MSAGKRHRVPIWKMVISSSSRIEAIFRVEESEVSALPVLMFLPMLTALGPHISGHRRQRQSRNGKGV